MKKYMLLMSLLILGNTTVLLTNADEVNSNENVSQNASSSFIIPEASYKPFRVGPNVFADGFSYQVCQYITVQGNYREPIWNITVSPDILEYLQTHPSPSVSVYVSDGLETASVWFEGIKITGPGTFTLDVSSYFSESSGLRIEGNLIPKDESKPKPIIPTDVIDDYPTFVPNFVGKMPTIKPNVINDEPPIIPEEPANNVPGSNDSSSKDPISSDVPDDGQSISDNNTSDDTEDPASNVPDEDQSDTSNVPSNGDETTESDDASNSDEPRTPISTLPIHPIIPPYLLPILIEPLPINPNVPSNLPGEMPTVNPNFVGKMPTVDPRIGEEASESENDNSDERSSDGEEQDENIELISKTPSNGNEENEVSKDNKDNKDNEDGKDDEGNNGKISTLENNNDSNSENESDTDTLAADDTKLPETGERSATALSVFGFLILGVVPILRKLTK